MNEDGQKTEQEIKAESKRRSRIEDINNRFTYHPPKSGQPEQYTAIRNMAKDFALLLEAVCPESREFSLALTSLEESVMWANASIARHG